MIDTDEKQNHFLFVNTNPGGKVPEEEVSQSVINAISIATGRSWRDVYDMLFRQVRELCYMPYDTQCIKALLTDSGFVQQPGTSKKYSVEEVRSYMSEHCHDGQVAVVKTANYGHGGHMSAVVPTDSSIYEIRGTRDTRGHRAEEVWIRWTDGLDHSPVARRKGRTGAKKKKERKIPEDHSYFHYRMQNPKSNYIGDCVLRGIASVLDMDWRDVADAIAESVKYEYTVINMEDVYAELLRARGFTRYPAQMFDGRKPTGAQFCEMMADKYRNGERILAYVLRNHVAAVVPIREKDGTVRYKIEDTWDSSKRKIGNYWVENKNPVTKSALRSVPAQMNVGNSNVEEAKLDIFIAECQEKRLIIHPKFGKGRILKVEGSDTEAALEVKFASVGDKKISAKWAAVNCRLE